MSDNTGLRNAKRTRNDEFYTLYSDIEKEMKYYTEYFKGKVVYCNCDNPDESNFWRYFHLNFGVIGLKKLISTCYNNEFRKEYTGGCDNDVDAGETYCMKSTGDFRSDECIEILKQSDIVCTNPPFSLFREYISQLFEHGKDFIILGNQNAPTYKEVFPLIKSNKLWYGASIHSGGVDFRIPDDYEAYKDNVFIKDGHHYVNLGCIRWFTNIKHNNIFVPLQLTCKYSAEQYPHYDNYDAIEVSATKNIPCDYYGEMGVPITFLDKYNPNQFEIIGVSGELAKPIIVNGKKQTGRFCINGRRLYDRIVIKRKP